MAAAVLLLGVTGCEKPKPKAVIPPPEVVVSEVKQEAVPIIMKVPGTVQPIKTVQIVPRVSGYIFERNFTEGTKVKEGDSLYLIDPRPYQATLDSLKAELKREQATFQFWSGEANRYTRLAKKGAVSLERKEKAIARKAEATAMIDTNKADIENAELNLSFTKITAPFNGHIQNTLAYKGDLVHKQETELTTVLQIQPIYVISNISREQVYRIQQLRQQGLAPKSDSEFKAELVMPDGSIYSHQGSFNYISALIATSTDTLMIRYEFPNPLQGGQLSLIPGQYIPLRMIVGHRPDALLIPEKALLETQEGKHVYVVDKDNKVDKRMVTTGASHKQQWIINKGLKKGERIIVDGLQKVRPGMVVKVKDAKAEKPTTDEPAPDKSTVEKAAADKPGADKPKS